MLVRAIVLAGFAASLSGGLVAFALLGVLAPSAVLFSFDQGTCKVLHASQRPCDCQAQRDPPCLTCQDLEMQVQPPASPAYEIFVTAHGTSFVNGTTYPCIIDPADPTDIIIEWSFDWTGFLTSLLTGAAAAVVYLVAWTMCPRRLWCDAGPAAFRHLPVCCLCRPCLARRRPALVLLFGPPGVGKREVLSHAKSRGLLVANIQDALSSLHRGASLATLSEVEVQAALLSRLETALLELRRRAAMLTPARATGFEYEDGGSWRALEPLNRRTTAVLEEPPGYGDRDSSSDDASCISSCCCCGRGGSASVVAIIAMGSLDMRDVPAHLRHHPYVESVVLLPPESVYLTRVAAIEALEASERIARAAGCPVEDPDYTPASVHYAQFRSVHWYADRIIRSAEVPERICDYVVAPYALRPGCSG